MGGNAAQDKQFIYYLTYMSLQNFPFDLFTTGQADIIRTLVAKQEYDNIMAAIIVETPEQEMAISDLLSEIRPVSAPLESKVREELAKSLSADATNTLLDSPEKEAEWQARIDAERAAHEDEIKKKNKKSKKDKVETKE